MPIPIPDPAVLAGVSPKRVPLVDRCVAQVVDPGVWWSARDLAAGPLATWASFAGATDTLTATTGFGEPSASELKPRAQLNGDGYTVANFDPTEFNGRCEYLTSTRSLAAWKWAHAATGFRFHAVLSFDAVDAGARSFLNSGFGTGNVGFALLVQNGRLTMAVNAGGTNPLTSTTDVLTAGELMIVSGWWSPQTGHGIRINGASPTATSTDLTSPLSGLSSADPTYRTCMGGVFAAGAPPVTLAHNGGEGFYWAGDVAEMVITPMFDPADADVQLVRRADIIAFETLFAGWYGIDLGPDWGPAAAFVEDASDPQLLFPEWIA